MIDRIRPRTDDLSLSGRAEEADGRERSRAWRNDDGGHAERVGDGARVQGTGAAERDECEIAWVDAACDGHQPDGLLHRRVDDGDDTAGIDAGARPGTLLPRRRRGARGPGTSRQGRCDRARGRHPSLSGAVATASVARRTGNGACAVGSDDERAAGVETRDRPAARADRVHVERGEPNGVAGDDHASGAGSGMPPRTRHTSVLVPPMSNPTASGNPHALATIGGGPHASGGPRQQQRRRAAPPRRPRARAHHPRSSPAPGGRGGRARTGTRGTAVAASR